MQSILGRISGEEEKISMSTSGHQGKQLDKSSHHSDEDFTEDSISTSTPRYVKERLRGIKEERERLDLVVNLDQKDRHPCLKLLRPTRPSLEYERCIQDLNYLQWA